MATILIITAGYHPFIHPRAHRWTSLAEYWAAGGHAVHVLCARRRDCPNEVQRNGVHMHRTGFDSLKELTYFIFRSKSGRGRVGGGVRKPGLALRLASWFYKAIWKNLYFPDDACLWYFPARKKARALLKRHSFDAVITVSLPFSGHLIGLDLKRQNPNLPWLADIGDPFAVPGQRPNNRFAYSWLNHRLEKKVLKRANAVTITTPTLAQLYDRLFGPLARKPCVIPPLLHPLDIPSNPYQLLDLDLTKLHLGYFGAMYKPVRTPDALLNLLERTFAARPDLNGQVHLHIFGEVFPEFYKKLSPFEYIKLHGLRSREESRAFMQQMDMLINIGNTTTYQLPSKIVDYMASGRPVIHLSYVDTDPFIDFWGTESGVLNLPVWDNRVSEANFLDWIKFLTSVHTVDSIARKKQVAACTIEAVASVYERLILNSTDSQSAAKIEAIPDHR